MVDSTTLSMPDVCKCLQACKGQRSAGLRFTLETTPVHGERVSILWGGRCCGYIWRRNGLLRLTLIEKAMPGLDRPTCWAIAWKLGQCLDLSLPLVLVSTDYPELLPIHV